MTRTILIYLLGIDLAKNFSPGGLRGGGATLHYLSERNMTELQRRGRWKAPTTLEHYVQVAASLQAKIRWSTAICDKLERHGAPLAALLWTPSQLG